MHIPLCFVVNMSCVKNAYQSAPRSNDQLVITIDSESDCVLNRPQSFEDKVICSSHSISRVLAQSKGKCLQIDSMESGLFFERSHLTMKSYTCLITIFMCLFNTFLAS